MKNFRMMDYSVTCGIELIRKLLAALVEVMRCMSQLSSDDLSGHQTPLG